MLTEAKTRERYARRGLLGGFSILAALLLASSVAWACSGTLPPGATLYMVLDPPSVKYTSSTQTQRVQIDAVFDTVPLLNGTFNVYQDNHGRNKTVGSHERSNLGNSVGGVDGVGCNSLDRDVGDIRYVNNVGEGWADLSPYDADSSGPGVWAVCADPKPYQMTAYFTFI